MSVSDWLVDLLGSFFALGGRAPRPTRGSGEYAVIALGIVAVAIALRLFGWPRVGFAVLVGGFTPLVIVAWLALAAQVRHATGRQIVLGLGAVLISGAIWLGLVIVLHQTRWQPLGDVVGMVAGGWTAYPFVRRLLPQIQPFRYFGGWLAGAATILLMDRLFPWR